MASDPDKLEAMYKFDNDSIRESAANSTSSVYNVDWEDEPQAPVQDDTETPSSDDVGSYGISSRQSGKRIKSNYDKTDRSSVNITTVERERRGNRIVNAPTQGEVQDVQQITTFVDDGTIDITRAENARVLAAPSAIDAWDHSIRAVLSRPTLIGSYEWTTTQFGGTVLVNLDLSDQYFAVNDNANKKLSNFAFFRGELHIKVVLNAQQFQQGALGCYIIPMPEELSPHFIRVQGIELTNPTATAALLLQRTGYPFYTQLVANSGNEVELVVPYCNPCMWGTLTDTRTRQCKFQIQVQNPITQSDTTFSVYVWLEKVEVHMPTDKTNVPQGAGVTGTSVPNDIADARELLKQMQARYPGLTIETPEVAGVGSQTISGGVQGQGLMRQVATDVQQSTSSTSPDSSRMSGATKVNPLHALANAAADVATGVIKDIPIVGDVAESLGFANPHDTDDVSSLVQKPLSGFMHAKRKVKSTVMAPDNDYQVQVRNDIVPFKHDEMNISYLAQHPKLMNMFNWADADTSNKVIYQTGVVPHNMSAPSVTRTTYTTGADPATSIHSVNTAYTIARAFRYWRGSTRVRFDVVKTSFHSGRLLICYWPDSVTPRTTVTGAQATNIYNVVLDLKESSTVTLEIPFVSRTYYKNTLTLNNPKCGTVPESSADIRWQLMNCCGTLTVSVLNKLRRPTTASASVTINVWMSAGSDIEYVLPQSIVGEHNLYNDSNLPFDGTIIDRKEKVFGQGFETSASLTSSLPLNATKLLHTPRGARDSAVCYGHPVVSISLLLKRQCPILMPNYCNLYDEENADNLFSEISLNPWSFRPYHELTFESDGTAWKFRTSNQMGFLCYFSQCFIGFRGGLEMSIFKFGPTLKDPQVPQNFYSQERETIAVRNFEERTNTIRSFVYGSSDRVNQVLATSSFTEYSPVSNTYACLVNIPYIAGTTFITNNYDKCTYTNSFANLPNYCYNVNIESCNSYDKSIFVGAADDFRFVYFMGPHMLSDK